jgi:ABC-type amino acid transport substrate-binding protein
MTDWQPEQRFREALTKLDLGQADVIVTPEVDAAQWARDHGYRVDVGEMEIGTVYEIKPGDRPVP